MSATTGKRRKTLRNKPQAGEKLPTSEDKLFFLLVYLKANPLLPRKTDPEVQKQDYSGKAKDHTTKNGLISDEGGQIVYLSPTYQGKKHDKAICDEEGYQFPPGLRLRQDTGYQGYRPAGVTIIQPIKKPPGQQKQHNNSVSKGRVIVENAWPG